MDAPCNVVEVSFVKTHAIVSDRQVKHDYTEECNGNITRPDTHFGIKKRKAWQICAIHFQHDYNSNS